MSWMNRALETYEQNQTLAGKAQEGVETLLPVAHMAFKAQLEITIDQDGNLVRAQEVDKADCSTIIPVTEASGDRSGKYPSPHPLNDALGYIAGDFSKYNNSGNDCSWKFEKYFQGLKQWVESDYTHLKVQAIYKYVSKKHVIQDLIGCGIVSLTEAGKFDKKKIQGAEYEKVLVRFKVNDATTIGKVVSETWKDETLMKCYSEYYSSIQTGEEDVCYLTGKKAVITLNHPKGTLNNDFQAKLISTGKNFAFRGRFSEMKEACVVSYEASQKAHAALAWLSRKQGVIVGKDDKRTYIAWTVQGKKLDIFKSQVNSFFDTDDESADEPQTMPEFRSKLYKAFQGYAEQLQTATEQEDMVFLIGLDAATKGRLSVTYYNELSGSDFLRRMLYWEASCRWYSIAKAGKYIVKTPSIQQIVKNAFGTEQGDFIELDDRILKEQTERLIRCMTEQLPIPYDMVHALFQKASFPQCYKKERNRESVLSSACAVIAKYHYHDKKNSKEVLAMTEGDFDMELGESLKKDRSYLFGKLLATLEQVERDALYSKKEDRETNAIRLQSAFVSHPFTTWKVLEEALIPYYQQLHPRRAADYKAEVEMITEALLGLYQEDENNIALQLNRALTETYLLGYYLQRKALRDRIYKKKDTDEN